MGRGGGNGYMKLARCVVFSMLALSTRVAAQSAPAFERVFALRTDEGVFAYSRISPNGRFLAYAAETADPTR